MECKIIKNIQIPLKNSLCRLFIIITLLTSSTSAQQPSAYRLIASSNSYAQYSPWYPCLNGTLVFEFKTHEPNALLVYAQSLPYKYLHVSLTNGNLRVRMRLSESEDPRGVFLVHPNVRLNDEKWHEVKIVRANERTTLVVDSTNTYFHVHKDATNLDDLLFGNFQMASSNSNSNGQAWVIKFTNQNIFEKSLKINHGTVVQK
jgi:hypothetical protein